jgi:hypothetical protein
MKIFDIKTHFQNKIAKLFNGPPIKVIILQKTTLKLDEK